MGWAEHRWKGKEGPEEQQGECKEIKCEVLFVYLFIFLSKVYFSLFTRHQCYEI